MAEHTTKVHKAKSSHKSHNSDPSRSLCLQLPPVFVEFLGSSSFEFLTPSPLPRFPRARAHRSGNGSAKPPALGSCSPTSWPLPPGPVGRFGSRSSELPCRQNSVDSSLKGGKTAAGHLSDYKSTHQQADEPKAMSPDTPNAYANQKSPPSTKVKPSPPMSSIANTPNASPPGARHTPSFASRSLRSVQTGTSWRPSLDAGEDQIRVHRGEVLVQEHRILQPVEHAPTDAGSRSGRGESGETGGSRR